MGPYLRDMPFVKLVIIIPLFRETAPPKVRLTRFAPILHYHYWADKQSIRLETCQLEAAMIGCTI
jgi:hypothetical protein